MFRGRSAGHVEDHICKDVNALCLERIKHIPRGVPGADWRDLPNTRNSARDVFDPFQAKRINILADVVLHLLGAAQP